MRIKSADQDSAADLGRLMVVFAWALCGGLSVLLAGAVPASAQRTRQEPQLPDGVTVHRLESKDEAVTVWAMDYQTGRMFGSLLNTKQILEVSPEHGREVRRMNLPGEPTEMVVKAGKLVVNIPSTKQLIIIDLEANRPSATIDLELAAADLFAADAEDQYCYILADAGSKVAVSKFDVIKGELVHSNETSQFTVRQKIKGKSAAGSSALFVAVDEDKAGGSRVYRMDADLLTFQEAFVPRSGMQPPAFPLEISPAGRWWTLNGNLYDIPLESTTSFDYARANPEATVREFNSGSLTFHPKLDLVCGLSFFRNGRISLRKLSDATELATVPIGSSMFVYSGSQTLTHNLVYTLWNAKRQGIIAGPQTFIVMDFEQLKIPDERMMLIESPPLANANIGQDISLQLRTFPATPEQVTFTKASGPDGLKISEDGRLEWNPSSSEVGKHTIKVKATAGELTDEMEFLARVTRPEFKLNGVILGFQVNPAKTQALVACALPEQPGDDRYLSIFEEFGRREGDIIRRLFLLDLETMQVLAERELEEAAACILLTDEAAFVGHTNGGKLYRLKLEDLSEDQRKFLGGPPSALWQLNENTLFAATNFGGVGINTDDMSMVPLPGLRTTAEYDNYNNSRIQLKSFQQIARDRFTLRGVVIDAEANVHMVTQYVFNHQIPFIYETSREDYGLAQMLSQMSGGVHRDISPNAGYPQPWDRMTNYTGLFDVNGRRISGWSGAGKILADRPLAAVVQLVDEENPDRDFYYSDDFNREGELSLELRDLVEGRTVSRYPLAFVKYQRASQAIGQNAMHIAEAGDHILVGYGNTIYKLKLNPEEVADLKEPLTINKEIQPRTATVGEVVQIPVTARGGEGDITFRLTQDVDGLSIDAASGVLSIDTTKLWRNWLATDDYERTYLTRFDRDDGLSAAQESYENVFGESIEEIPFRVPFEVVAADSQGMSTRLSNQLVVLAPMAEWNALIKAREEEWERERARAAAERERLAAERAKAKAMEPGSASSAEISAVGDVIDDSLGQIAALSEQLKEMQAVLDDAKESSRADGEVSPAIQAKLDDVDEQLGEIQASLTERDQSNSNQVLFLLVLFVVVTVLAVAGGAIIAMVRRSKL